MLLRGTAETYSLFPNAGCLIRYQPALRVTNPYTPVLLTNVTNPTVPIHSFCLHSMFGCFTIRERAPYDAQILNYVFLVKRFHSHRY